MEDLKPWRWVVPHAIVEVLLGTLLISVVAVPGYFAAARNPADYTPPLGFLGLAAGDVKLDSISLSVQMYSDLRPNAVESPQPDSPATGVVDPNRVEFSITARSASTGKVPFSIVIGGELASHLRICDLSNPVPAQYDTLTPDQAELARNAARVYLNGIGNRPPTNVEAATEAKSWKYSAIPFTLTMTKGEPVARQITCSIDPWSLTPKIDGGTQIAIPRIGILAHFRTETNPITNNVSYRPSLNVTAYVNIYTSGNDRYRESNPAPLSRSSNNIQWRITDAGPDGYINEDKLSYLLTDTVSGIFDSQTDESDSRVRVFIYGILAGVGAGIVAGGILRLVDRFFSARGRGKSSTAGPEKAD